MLLHFRRLQRFYYNFDWLFDDLMMQSAIQAENYFKVCKDLWGKVEFYSAATTLLRTPQLELFRVLKS